VPSVVAAMTWVFDRPAFSNASVDTATAPQGLASMRVIIYEKK